MKLEFPRQIFEKKLSNYIKICILGAELFHVDGRTDGQMDRHDETNSRFSQFTEKRLKMVTFCFFLSIKLRPLFGYKCAGTSYDNKAHTTKGSLSNA